MMVPRGPTSSGCCGWAAAKTPPQQASRQSKRQTLLAEQGRAITVRSWSSVAFPTSRASGRAPHVVTSILPCAERLAAGGLRRQASSCRCVGSCACRSRSRTPTPRGAELCGSGRTWDRARNVSRVNSLREGRLRATFAILFAAEAVHDQPEDGRHDRDQHAGVRGDWEMHCKCGRGE
jgi:hypothetical protein